MPKKEQSREQVIDMIVDLMNHNRVTFEIQVKKDPKGVKVIYEVTQEQLDAMMEKVKTKEEQDNV